VDAERGGRDVESSKWIDVLDGYPTGNLFTGVVGRYSEQVLVANSCAVETACYDRKMGWWLIGEIADEEWIDKITHWMPLPRNPHLD
jgi:hypothetical protein